MVTERYAREGRVDVRGGRTWYRLVGDGPGVPLVTVHGGPGGTHDYLEPLEALADERPVLFYDQLGAGRSDPADDPALWTNDRMVEELGDVIRALGLSRVHLLGHSWGTIVVAEYALSPAAGNPVSLVLSGPCLSMPRFAAGAAQLRAELPADVRLVLDRHEAAGTTDSPEYEEATMEFNRRYLCRLDPWPEPLQRAFNQLNQSIYEHMQGPSEFQVTGLHKDYDITDRLGGLAVPTLFMCGRYDETRPEDTEFYRRLVPNAELEIFEGSSHVPHLEEPERYLYVLRDFLRRHDLSLRNYLPGPLRV